MTEPETENQLITKNNGKLKDKLEKNIVWFALGFLLSGAGAGIYFVNFISDRVKSEVQSQRVVEILTKTIRSLPKGSLILFGGKCPDDWEDLTSTFNDRYVYIDLSATENIKLYDDDSSHEHTGGTHTHKVTGRTGPLGGGEARGKENRDAAHKSNTTTITGTAHPEDPPHTHSGGKHQHRRIGLRLCKA